MKRWIDINADLGEGTGLDEAIMPLISSCSIACGGHFGTEETMRTAVKLAKKYKVKIGAHPSFPDKDNFGRKVLTITKKELTQTVYHQILQFLAVCEMEDAEINHIKLHGALYNYAAKDAATADAVVEAISNLKFRPKLYVPHGSILHRKAENLLPLVYEAFIDRRYEDDGTLVHRGHLKALISDPEEAWEHLIRMIINNEVITLSGKSVSMIANTFCIHGDSPNSVKILEYINTQLESENIYLER
ncbi:MAG: 5-oxoprolinase subunit PxpA [Bacteroidia bacterium]|nr:5-oxoprolinase subunit PxpA [Bacteroidia bacterium]MBT8275869.1 5-oxoprolinase subunit PxpA [Bacteroidia bacterium]NNF31243.1 5-oxoprolinase subunit PxpA [Flavobacteriaceae bacterium]NNK54562.1 5-oxoprolinase subunit PxpA [Flavobacteriaceae bacterium]NNM09369.1 5-oxoprolinase subunit PxpA [Flavobacteriaceae bacterium]